MVNMKTSKGERLNIDILGFSREGQSVLRYLLAHPNAKKFSITIRDINPKTKKFRVGGVSYKLGPGYLASLGKSDIIIRSPGVPYLTRQIQDAKKAGVVITSPTQIFFEEVARFKLKNNSHLPKLVGVTGTKGKGTVCALLFKMLKLGGKRAVLAGNMGRPMLDELEKAKKSDVVILELSSFQLQDMSLSPDVAVLLPITPDHLDHHKTLNEYIRAKSAIARNQKEEKSAIFYFSGSQISKKIAGLSSGKKIAVRVENFNLFSQQSLKLKGAHMFFNAVMAASVAEFLGVAKKTIAQAAQKFTSVEHRMQLARVVRRNGRAVLFYNDSAGTNPETAAAAISAFSQPSILIAGGADKGLNFEPLKRALKKSSVVSVLLLGENKNKIARQIRACGKKIVFVKNLREAVKKSFSIGLKHQESVVVFSPASASFDSYSDYAQRGKAFISEVSKL